MLLPHLPSSWAELSWQQLVDIWNIIEHHADHTARGITVYSYLTGVKIQYVDKYLTPDLNPNALCITYNGTTSLVNAADFFIYLFGVPVKSENKSQAEELQLPTSGVLSWLDEPHTLVQLPQEYYQLGRHKLKLPEPLFTSLTYQQYGNMQKILQAYWNIAKQLNSSQSVAQQHPSSAASVSGAASPATVPAASAEGSQQPTANSQSTSQQREMEKLRAQFMSHALCSRTLRIIKRDADSMSISPKFVYTYSVERAEKNIRLFYKAPNYLFNILQQYFSSCLEYYRKEMPELFSKSGQISSKSPLLAEIDTVNAIMKWKGAYPTQQDVYDANAIFIFGDLKDMAKEAREIERANARIKKP